MATVLVQFSLYFISLTFLFYCSDGFSEIIKFEITTDSENFAASNVRFSLNWNNTLYECDFSPDSADTVYICDTNFWDTGPITPNSYAPYFMKITYDSTETPFQISKINVTFDKAPIIWYSINEFCIR